jgi:hypothetical protein
MTRHYTHIGDDAARLALAALPDTDGTTPQRVDPIPEHVARDLGRMTEENWKEIRDSLLAVKVEPVVVEAKQIGYIPKK